MSVERRDGDTDADMAGRLLISLARLMRMLRREAPTWLGAASVSALATLVREGALRPGDLAGIEGVRPPTMTRVVAGLEADGYVRRAPDPSDGRAWLVQATPAGEELIQGATAARAHLLLARIAELPPADREALARAVDVLVRISDSGPSPAR